MPLIDSHAHTNFDAFDEDRAEVYARAREAGVEAIIEVGVGLAGSRAACERATTEPRVFAAAGLHPTGLAESDDHAGRDWQADWEAFVALFDQDAPRRPVAVGECGLDYYWMKSPEDVQAEAFRRQLDLARDLELPYIVHCRDADDDLVKIIGEHGYAHGVVHCFGGTPDHARALLEFGLHISFCGNITYKSAEGLRDAARVVPVDRLLLETDSPFLSPKPKRGRRNEPAYVEHTARFLAELKGVSFEELTDTATRTTKELFSL